MSEEEMNQLNADSSSESSSDDSSNSSSDAEAEDDTVGEECALSPEQQKEVYDLEANLKANPYLYDAHVKLIDIYRRCGQWEKLTASRQRMREHYPLSPQLWLSWLKDEQRRSTSKEAKEKLIVLFKAACADYQSVDLWLEYCTFAIDCMTDFGNEWVQSVFEEALSHVGGHISRGAQVWAAYRDFEMIRMAQMAKAKDDKQFEAISKLFKRQLSLPLIGIAEVMEEFKEWTTNVPVDVQASFDRAKTALTELEPLVEAIEDADGDEERLKSHVALIDLLERRGVPSRIIVAYEDALTAVCLRADLWLRFLNYLARNLLTAEAILPQCRRAVRNCPWSLNLWLFEAEMLERFSKDEKIIRKTYEDALQAGFTESSDFLRLWTEYASYLRRKIDWSLSIDVLKASKEVEELRDIFERAVIQLEKYFNLFGDPNCSLFRFWAFVEAKYLSNLAKARELWSEVMKRKHGNEAHMWLEYINFERAYGDPKHCRKVLARAVNSVTDWPEHVFEACLRFEREEGTLESYLDVRTKIEQQRTRLTERALAAAAKEEAAGGSSGRKGADPRQDRRGKKRTAAPPTAADMGPIPTAPKRTKEDFRDTAPTKDSEGFVVPTAPKMGPQAVNKTAPPPGFFEHKARQEEKMETQDIVAAAEKAETKHGIHVEHDETKEHVTVFVSNLNFNTNEAALKEVLEKCGEIKEVRLVRDHRGRSKGYAYVEFTTEAAATAALACDRSAVEGRPMFVSECNPNKRHSFQFAAGLEKNKLFVRNLPRTITKHALETLFGQYGKVTAVRIATFRNGSPKGHAYVDFANDDDASRALVATDNLLIGDKNISVALSNPPTRKEISGGGGGDVGQDVSMALGCGKKTTADHGRARTQVALMPRALQRKTTAPSQQPQQRQQQQRRTDGAGDGQANGAGASEPKPKSGGLSNEEFRKLFLKK